MSAKSLFYLSLELANEQRRTIAEPCKSLDCSVSELEERLDRLEPETLAEVGAWLGMEPQRLLLLLDEHKKSPH